MHRLSSGRKASSYPPMYAHAYKEFIVNNDRRNKIIVNTCKIMYNLGFNSLILVNSKAHGSELMRELRKNKVCLMTGGSSIEYYDEIGDYIQRTITVKAFKSMMKDGTIKTVIGTQLMDQGYDLPDINFLALACSGSKKRRLIQRLGRLIRKKDNVNYAYMLDFFDCEHKYMRSQSYKRRDVYDRLQINVFDDLNIIIKLANLQADLLENGNN